MKSSDQKPRSCPACKKAEPEVKFYRSAVECRSCIRTRVASDKVPLAEQVEAHRQNKLLREELKRLAKLRVARRLEARQRRAAKEEREKRVAKLIPEASSQITETPVEVDAATKELAQRVLLRRRLIEFVKEFHPKYNAGWVHHDICRRLEKFAADVAAGKSPRLMLLMPPRHGKSQIASRLFPAWYLGHNPDHEIIACSYNIDLARDFSREVRDVISSQRYHTLFPKTRLSDSSQAVEAWKLQPTEGVITGGYVAAGIGGPINGKGAHVLIIDDPIKNEQEASSIDHLQKIQRWFDSTAYTRLAPGGGVLIIQTWWSDQDLAGKLQEEAREDPEADQYEVIKYPAIAVEDEEFRLKGEALHPGRWPLSALEKIKRKLGGDKGRFWNALYQQNPIPDEGAFFTKAMFVYRDERPNLNNCHIYQAWDFAIGEKRTNDWTVGVTVAVDPHDFQHVIEMVRVRTSDMLAIADEMIDMYERYTNVMRVGVEDGQIWRGVRTHFTKRCLERRASPTMEELKALTDKTVRARPLQGRMQQRRVTFPKQAEWLPVVLKEFLRFPVGMHDDTVDALSWCMTMALSASPPRAPAPPKHRRKELTLAEQLKKLGVGGKKGSAMAA